MACCAGGEWICAGGNSGGDGSDEDWDLKPIYRSLVAAYGWTYTEVDSHTLAEVKELFAGWDEHTPTNILLKGLIQGLSGGPKTASDDDGFHIPPHVQDVLQASAVAAIGSKADPSWLPVRRGVDPGMPGIAPVFDLDELRHKNAELIRKRTAKDVSSVG